MPRRLHRAIARLFTVGGAPRIGWILLLCLAPTLASAALRYGQDNGLSSVHVQALARDERGFLWIGTQDGALRFDSHRFVAIEVDRGQAVPDPHVRRLLAVPGAVYLATRTRLHRYDLARETLSRVDSADGEISGITALKLDHDGRIYAGTERGDIYRWRDRAGTGLQARRLAITGELPSINEFAPGRDRFWIATMRGTYGLDRATLEVAPLPLSLPQISDGRLHVSAIHEDRLGTLWIGFWNDGLVRHDLATGVSTWLHPKLGNSGALRSTSIFSFLEREDRLYIGTNRGLAVFHRDCDCLRGLNLPEWDAREGSGYVVTSLVGEGDGLWAGVWGTGLVRFSPYDEVIEHQVPIEGRSDSLGHPMVYSLAVDAEQRLWIGTYGGGAHWVDADQRQPGRHWPLQRIPFGERRVESRFIWNLQPRADAVLVGSGQGLFGWQGGTLRDIDRDVQSIRSLLRTRDGIELVGTMFGLYRADRLDVGRLQPVPAADPGLGRAVWSMLERGDEIWLGTDKGIERLDRQLRPIRSHGVGAGADALPGAVVWTQKLSADGRAWLGTNGGLVEVPATPAEPRFLRHPLLAEAEIRGVGSIEFAADGALWLGTPRGIARYRPEHGELELLDGKDGLVSTQINLRASANDGRYLYFGGIGGFVAIDPGALPPRRTQMKPSVVAWRLGQGSWHPAADRIALPHDHAPLQLEFSAFHYARPENVRYAYRWAPDESEYTELGDARSAIFSRLPAGLHRLHLRTRVGGSTSATVEDEVLTVEVTPVWYQTWLGRGLLLLAALALVYGGVRMRLQQSRRYARSLERVVSQRTRELSAAKYELEQANERLRQQVSIDPLTGLANRRALFVAAEQMTGREQHLGVLLIDLDHFKQVNDRHGHDAGDAVLVDFAQLLRSQLRQDVVAARYGGEEFVVLCGDANPAALASIADRLVQGARQRRVATAAGNAIHYTISIGVAQGTTGESPSVLLKRADEALYRAKAEGRNRWLSAAPAGTAEPSSDS